MYPFFCNFRKFRYLCISNRKARPSRASFRPDFRLQKSTTSPDGGIGRRAGLKHQWSNPCRFDPGSGYKQKMTQHYAGSFFACTPSQPQSAALTAPFRGIPPSAHASVGRPRCTFFPLNFLWIVGNMENVCTFVPSLIKVCYNLLQKRHHPNDVFSFFLDSYRGAYSEPPRIVFTSSKQFNQ